MGVHCPILTLCVFEILYKKINQKVMLLSKDFINSFFVQRVGSTGEIMIVIVTKITGTDLALPTY
jgi:hypothetical protein